MSSQIAVYDRPPVTRGDTVLGWQITVSVNESPAEIIEARMQFRQGARLVYQAEVAVAGGVVTVGEIPPEDCAAFPVGELDYDLEITLGGGRVVTWLKGKQRILADVTY